MQQKLSWFKLQNRRAEFAGGEILIQQGEKSLRGPIEALLFSSDLLIIRTKWMAIKQANCFRAVPGYQAIEIALIPEHAETMPEDYGNGRVIFASKACRYLLIPNTNDCRLRRQDVIGLRS